MLGGKTWVAHDNWLGKWKGSSVAAGTPENKARHLRMSLYIYKPFQ